jgi:uncharacterized membrane protein
MKPEDAAALLRKTVTDIETRTAVDVVAVLRARSSSYDDVALLFAAVCTWLWLCFVVYSPVAFDDQWWPAELAVIFVISWLVGQRLPWLRHVIFNRRLKRQVTVAASAAFVERGIDRTGQRLGTLIYVSAFEGQARILPDQNAQAKLTPGKLVVFEEQLARAWAHGSVENVCAVMLELGKYLAEQFPPNGHEHELSDDAQVGGPE